jgi:hypothetical protein
MYLFWEVDNSLQKTGIEILNSRAFLCAQKQLGVCTEPLSGQNCMWARCQASLGIRE